MQTQRTILLVIFSMSLLLLWDAWQKHNGQASMFSAPAPSAQKAKAPATGATDVPVLTAPLASTAGVAAVPPSAITAPGAPETAASSRLITLQNDVLALTIDTLGGSIVRAELLQYRDADNRKSNAVLLDSAVGKTYLAQTGLIGAVGLPTHRTLFDSSAGSVVASTPANGIAQLELNARAGGIALRKTYRLEAGSYRIAVSHELRNETEQTLTPSLYLQLTRDAHKPSGESQFYSTYTGPVVYNEAIKFQKVDFADIDKGKAKPIALSDDGWAGIIQHYFVAAWIPQSNTKRELFTRKVDGGLYSVGAIQPLPSLVAGAQAKLDANLYIGPENQRVLEAIAPGLDLVVDYGVLAMIAKPLYWLLETLHSLVNNWGWAIVLLTIVVKLAFFPLQAASYRSMAKMKLVTPKMTALRERYGDDRIKLNQAMMELYKTEKVNPMAGCLPIVVQIPVFISLYWVLLASVEMRDAPWIGWIQDLAMPDPYYILPLVMAGTMFAQTKLNPTPPDPVQAKIMMFMPLVFSVMFFFFPAGLVLYWLVNNLFSIAQQWYITRQIESAGVAKKG